MIPSDTTIKTIDDLITSENLEFIYNSQFGVDDYYEILDEIIDETVNDLELDDNLSALENIKRIASQHVNIYYSEKGVASGYYIYNKLYLNNTLPESQQIVTIIHELTHHIYAEIFEKWLHRLFNVKECCMLEALVMFMLNNSIENRAADEYLSYIVEGRFTPTKYQNYLSFIQLLIELDINVENSKDLFLFAHEISHDIDNILRPVINDKLRCSIEEQFIKDNIDALNQKLTFDYKDERYDDVEKVEIMKEMIFFIFDYFVNGEGNVNDLNNYISNFDKELY